MPQRERQATNQYLVQAKAGGGLTNPTTDKDARIFIEIQNVGINEGGFFFGQSKNFGQGVRLGPMDYRRYDVHCPTERVFFFSTLGTNFAVIEGFESLFKR